MGGSTESINSRKKYGKSEMDSLFGKLIGSLIGYAIGQSLYCSYLDFLYKKSSYIKNTVSGTEDCV